MDDNFISLNSKEHLSFVDSLERMTRGVESVTANGKLALGGEQFITDKELSEILRVTRRTLQEYRDNGWLPYYQPCGKILYKVSKIEKILQDGYVGVFE